MAQRYKVNNFVDGSLGVNHDNDTATDPVFKDELLFRLITTISF